tara:strand:- start:319 stop:894 length:576 start_codon:yes stop_codon:yes gene_type:complete
MRVVDYISCEAIPAEYVLLKQIEEDDGTVLVFLTFLVSPSDDLLGVIEEGIRDVMKQIWEKKIMYHLILDTSLIPLVSMSTAMRINYALKERREAIDMYLHSTAFVCNNTVIRSVANRVFQIFPATKPLKFFVPKASTAALCGRPDALTDTRCEPNGAPPRATLSSADSEEILTFLRSNRDRAHAWTGQPA